MAEPEVNPESTEFSETFAALQKGEAPPEPKTEPAVEEPEGDAAEATQEEVTDPVEAEQPETDPPETEAPEEPEDDQEARRQEGRAAKAKRELQDAQDKLKRVNDELAQKSQQPEDSPAESETPAEPAPATDDSFASDFPEYAQSVDQRIQSAIEGQMKGFQGTIKQQQDEIAKLNQQLAAQEISNAHGANWYNEMVDSGEVDGWISQQNEYAQREATRIIESGTPGEISKLLSDVKGSASPAQAETPKPPAQRTTRAPRSAPPKDRQAGPDPNDFSGTYKELEAKRLAMRDGRAEK